MVSVQRESQQGPQQPSPESQPCPCWTLVSRQPLLLSSLSGCISGNLPHPLAPQGAPAPGGRGIGERMPSAHALRSSWSAGGTPWKMGRLVVLKSIHWGDEGRGD